MFDREGKGQRTKEAAREGVSGRRAPLRGNENILLAAGTHHLLCVLFTSEFPLDQAKNESRRTKKTTD